MPFNKPRRKRYRKRGKSSLAVRAYKMAKTNRKLVQGEQKYCDTDINGNVTATTGVVIPLGLIAQGIARDERIGDDIRATSLNLKIQLNNNDSNTAATTRIVLFSQNTDTTAVPTMHGTSSTDYLETAHPLAHRDIANKTDYHCFWDIILPGNSASVDHWVLEKYFDLKHKMIYNGILAVQASVGKGQLYLGLFTDATTNQPAYKVLSRLRYVDN